MSDKVIEIRSNITSSVIRFEALEEERKKREEEERKERWAREEEERKRIREEWQTKHPNMEKYTYCSAYNFENMISSKECFFNRLQSRATETTAPSASFHSPGSIPVESAIFRSTRCAS